MSAELALARETLAKVIATHADEIGTHFDSCWKYHAGCLAVLVRDQIDGLAHYQPPAT